jgi:hypothetical protein
MRALMLAGRSSGTMFFHGDAQLLVQDVALSRQAQRQTAGNHASGQHQRMVMVGGPVCRSASVSTPEFSFQWGCR